MILSNYGYVYSEDFLEVITRLSLRNPIILDPQAETQLKHIELVKADSIVIGGIMGDHPPRGRTKELITSKAPHIPARNLGKGQLTIAGTAYVVKQIEDGKELEELDLREGLSIEVNINDITLTIELPYTFPYENGKPVLPADYTDIILRKSLIYEEDPCKDDY